MKLKINNQLSKTFSEKLQTLIGSHIRIFLASHCNYFLNTQQFFFNEVLIEFKKDEMFHHLKIQPVFDFNEILNDELSNLKISMLSDTPVIDDFSTSYVPIKIMTYNNPFEIKKIKVFGQNRIRYWDAEMIDNYFCEDEKPEKVMDFLFTNEFIIFENSSLEQLVFSQERKMIGFQKDRNFEKRFINDFYSKEELKETIDLFKISSEEDNCSDELRYKLNYHFT